MLKEASKTMIELTGILIQFGEKGEKTGWTYLKIPAAIAHEIKPDTKVSFRVKGFLDEVSHQWFSFGANGRRQLYFACKNSIAQSHPKRKRRNSENAIRTRH